MMLVFEVGSWHYPCFGYGCYCAGGTISALAIYDRPRFICVFHSAACCSLHSYIAYCTRAALAAWPRHRTHVYLATAIMFSELAQLGCVPLEFRPVLPVRLFNYRQNMRFTLCCQEFLC